MDPSYVHIDIFPLLFSDLDDVILSYVVSILEDMTEDEDDDFDVDSLMEMLQAYVPGTEEMGQEEIRGWMEQMAKDIRDKNKKGKNDLNRLTSRNLTEIVFFSETKSDFDLKSVIQETCKTRTHKSSLNNSASAAEASDISDQKPKVKRIQRLSEGDAASSSDSSEAAATGDELLKQLLEMFPYSCDLEVSHCLNLMAGDVERTAQLIIHRHENGQELKPTDKKVAVF